MRSLAEMSGTYHQDVHFRWSSSVPSSERFSPQEQHQDPLSYRDIPVLLPIPDARDIFIAPEHERDRRSVRVILKRHASVPKAEYGHEDAHLDQRGIDMTYIDAHTYLEKLCDHPERGVIVSLMYSPLPRVKETANIYFDVLSEAQENGDIPHVTINEPNEWVSLETTYPAQAYHTRNPEIPKPEVVKSWITDKEEAGSRSEIESALYGIIHRLDALAAQSQGDQEIDNFLFVSETAQDILLYHLIERGLYVPQTPDSTRIFDKLKDSLVPKIAHLEEFVLDLAEDDAIYGYFREHSIRIPREELQHYLDQ